MLWQAFVVGVVSGLATGVFGIGSGFVLLILLLGMGMAIPNAVAICLIMQLIPQTLPAVWMYYKKGYVNVPLAVVVAIGSLAGVAAGAWLTTTDFMSERLQGRILTALVACSLVFLLYRYFGQENKHVT